VCFKKRRAAEEADEEAMKRTTIFIFGGTGWWKPFCCCCLLLDFVGYRRLIEQLASAGINSIRNLEVFSEIQKPNNISSAFSH